MDLKSLQTHSLPHFHHHIKYNAAWSFQPPSALPHINSTSPQYNLGWKPLCARRHTAHHTYTWQNIISIYYSHSEMVRRHILCANTANPVSLNDERAVLEHQYFALYPITWQTIRPSCLSHTPLSHISPLAIPSPLHTHAKRAPVLPSSPPLPSNPPITTHNQPYVFYRTRTGPKLHGALASHSQAHTQIRTLAHTHTHTNSLLHESI